MPAARSRAELAALTADLPAGLTTRLPRASDIWTGTATTFDIFHNDGSLDTLTVTSRVGEHVPVSH